MLGKMDQDQAHCLDEESEDCDNFGQPAWIQTMVSKEKSPKTWSTYTQYPFVSCRVRLLSLSFPQVCVC